MCILSGEATFVGGTRILARAPKKGAQLLAYAMTLGASRDLAMVLPLPVPVGTGDDAVRFIDLSGYPALFDDLDDGFPVALAAPAPASGLLEVSGAAPQPLEVHKVGAFRASFVPSQADFDRLDECFTLSDAVWEALPLYGDYGFAVFEFNDWGDTVGPKRFHPMAFEFPTRDPARLYFPTVHVHDGTVQERAMFDHTLYCQDSTGWFGRTKSNLGANADLSRSSGDVASHVDVDSSAGLIVGSLPCFRKRVWGDHPNADQWLRL